MSWRAARLTLIALVALAAPALALEVRWQSGSTDLSFVGSRRCTLVVSCTLPAEELPTEFRILYAGASFTPDPVAILLSQGGGDYAVACEAPDNPTIDDWP